MENFQGNRCCCFLFDVKLEYSINNTKWVVNMYRCLVSYVMINIEF